MSRAGRRRATLTGARFQSRWAGSLAVLTFPEEIDIANARQAGDELNSLLARQPAILVVDMTGTRFCDSSGIAALIQARKRAAALRTTLRIAGVRDSIIRVMRVAGADQLFEFCPSLDVALGGQSLPGREEPEGGQGTAPATDPAGG
jgi:anti-anti-sigma factor